MVKTRRSTSAASPCDHSSRTATSASDVFGSTPTNSGLPELDDQLVAARGVGDQRRELVDPVLADRGQQRQPDAHPDRARRPGASRWRRRTRRRPAASTAAPWRAATRSGRSRSRRWRGRRTSRSRSVSTPQPVASHRPTALRGDPEDRHRSARRGHAVRARRPPAPRRRSRSVSAVSAVADSRIGAEQDAVDEDRPADHRRRQRVAGQQADEVGRGERAVGEQPQVDERRARPQLEPDERPTSATTADSSRPPRTSGSVQPSSAGHGDRTDAGCERDAQQQPRRRGRGVPGCAASRCRRAKT